MQALDVGKTLAKSKSVIFIIVTVFFINKYDVKLLSKMHIIRVQCKQKY